MRNILDVKPDPLDTLRDIHNEQRWKRIEWLYWRVEPIVGGFEAVVLNNPHGNTGGQLYRVRYIGRDRAEDAAIAFCHKTIREHTEY